MKRIKELRKENKMTMKSLGAEIGVSESTVSLYESGNRQPDYATLRKIASLFGVTVDYLLDEDDNVANHVPGIIPLDHVTYIPLIGKIACGKPILAEENIGRRILLPDDVKADFALNCKGDSMIDANIEDGDIVYLRQQSFAESGDIAAVLIDGEYETQATLKKVFITSDSLTLMPCNEEYAPITFVKKDMNNVRIIGKVVAVLKKVSR